MGTASAKSEIEKFTSENDFNLWRLRLKLKVLLVQQALEDALADEEKLSALGEGG
ncbi:hypothetical protein A2U01_0030911 [Trifolium medium]|uniref:Uncharacterized protein n=1 Tax=Trifolium medium TaxID=97028 RepID=A0A392PEC0_9FABA|nr:hypothetical protein [Trifolium medium]